VKRTATAAIVIASTLAIAPHAHAEGEPRIVVVASTPDDSIALRIRAELKALHFEVVELTESGPPSREPLEGAARRSDAVAAVRLVPSSAGVEVWIVDRVTGKTVLREIVSDDPRSPAASATIALRVVELLRASLMELNAPRPPPGEIEPPLLVRELVPPAPAPLPAPPPSPARRPLLSVELGPAALLSPGGLSPSGQVSAAVHVMPSAHVGASVLALIPVAPASLRGPEGRAAAHLGFVGIGILGVFRAPDAIVSPALGAGISAVFLGFAGTPARPFLTGTTDNVITFAPYLRAGLGLRVASHLRVRADVLGGATIMRPVVTLADRVAAKWGTPFFAPTLGLELGWP
jgi:hypothetical protein